MNRVSIIISTENHFDYVGRLAARINDVCQSNKLHYEMVFVDDHSTDNTFEYLAQLERHYPIRLFSKEGKKGKGQAITEALKYVKYDTIVLLDADLRYAPEAIPNMLAELANGADIVVADNPQEKRSRLKRGRGIYDFIVGKFLKSFDFDVHSGLKIFRKTAIEKLHISSSERSFDLEFMVKAKKAGLRIIRHDLSIPEEKFGNNYGIFDGISDFLRSAFASTITTPAVLARPQRLIHELGGKQILHREQYSSEAYETPPKKLPYNHTAFQISHTLYIIFALISVGLFAFWWFQPMHIPENFTGDSRFFDVLLFLFVSYIIWHPIMMDVLTWAISSHIKAIRKQKPINGMSVAFITTIVPSSESLDLLHKCLPAMVHADYKHDTWLLDEGNSSKVREICDLYGVHYFSRKGIEDYNTSSGKYTRTKGGNHNSWYDMYGHAYDIVAQIDTDFVPKKNFLSATLGYFRDPKVAFVGTPQIYGNINESIVARGAAEQLYTFYGTVLQGLSSMGMTLLIGANHVIRTSALKGVDLYSAHITEDLITGMKLHSQGWRSVYLSYPLAIGEGPFSWEAYFSQQMRWAYGCIDIFLRYTPRMFWKMGLRRSIYYFFLQQHYFSGVAMALSMVLLTVYFITGIRAADIDLFRFFLYYSLIVVICWLMSIWLQRFNVDRKDDGELHMAGKIISIAAWPVWFLAFLSVITGKKISYKVTPKGDNESVVRTSLNVFIPHIAFGMLALLGIIISFITGHQSPGMIFWAASSAVLMLSVPFAQELFDSVIWIKETITGKIHTYYENYKRWAVQINKPLFFPRPFVHNRRSMRNKPHNIVVPTTKLSPFGKVFDSIFLSVIMLLSVSLYINQIGFYSDDWSFLGNFVLSQDQSLWGLFQTASTPNTAMRPVQNFLDAFLFWIFGLNPLGYQVFNAVVLTTNAVLFYLILRQIKVPRIIAICIPLIYALLPNYSTDRFWFAVFQANVSMFFYFLSLFAALKAVSFQTVWASHWKIVSIISLMLGALSYEVAIPLYLINIIILLNPTVLYKKLTTAKPMPIRNNTIFIILILIALGYMFLFKMKTTTRLSNMDFNYYLELITSAFSVNYGTWILSIPHIWGQTISLYATPSMFMLAGALYLIIFWYLYYVSTRPQVIMPSVAWMRNLTFISFAIFLLGYAIFFTNSQVGFSPTGIDNRVAIAGAIGVAITIVGFLGWMTRLLLPEKIARISFCILIAIMSTGSFLVVNAIATFWIRAHQEGQIILADIREQHPTIPAGSTLILDGVCAYVGPAPVFEAEWDLKGALQTYYKDPTMRADIVTPRMKVMKSHLETQIYTFPAKYPYKKLFVYNFDTKTTHPIKDAQAARDYFNTYNPDYSNGCPVAHAGKGVPIF